MLEDHWRCSNFFLAYVNIQQLFPGVIHTCTCTHKHTHTHTHTHAHTHTRAHLHTHIRTHRTHTHYTHTHTNTHTHTHKHTHTRTHARTHVHTHMQFTSHLQPLVHPPTLQPQQPLRDLEACVRPLAVHLPLHHLGMQVLHLGKQLERV